MGRRNPYRRATRKSRRKRGYRGPGNGDRLGRTRQTAMRALRRGMR